MTQKQFNAIKAQIEKTDKMINDATTKVKSDIEKRVDKLIEKMAADFPILVQTVKECDMQSVKTETDNFEIFINRKDGSSPDVFISVYKNSNESMKKEMIFDEPFPKDEAEQKLFLEEQKKNYIKWFTNTKTLQKAEQFFAEIKDVQSAIRETSIKHFQELSNEKMQKLTELQAV